MKKMFAVSLVFVFSLVFTGAVLANDYSTTVISDESVMVYGPLTYYAELNAADWGNSKSAMLTWISPYWPETIPGSDAKWISTSEYIGDLNDNGPIGENSWRKFSKNVDLCTGAYNIQGTVIANSDNVEEFYVNGALIYSAGTVEGPPVDNWEWSTILTTPFETTPADSLALEFIVRNFPGSSDPMQNPTGIIFEIDITYDCTLPPEAGFVTGGGWIMSPEGAYKPDPSLTGKANYGFVSKYKKGANVPNGSTEFQFKAGDLNFHSTSYEWLVVADNTAIYRGEGTINGQGSYMFMLWAVDDSPDTFRIQIWDDNGIIYDNGMDQAVDGGNIVIHTQKLSTK